MDFGTYTREYFVGGKISGYGNYDDCQGILREPTDIVFKINGRPKTYLDVGCAYGFTVGRARDLGVEAYGVEPPTFALQKAKEKSWAQHVREDSLPDLKTVDRKYELVTSFEVLEHVPQKDLRRSVERLMEVTEDSLWIMPQTGAEDPHDHDVTHISVLPPEWWEKLFVEMGINDLRDRKAEAAFDSEPKVKEMFWAGRLYVFKPKTPNLRQF